MTSLKGQATPEQIAKWKQEYPDGISAIEVGEHILYVRNPDMNDLNFAGSQATDDAPLDYYKVLLNEIYIGGSKEALNDVDCMKGMIKVLKPLIDGKKAKLVKL